MSVHSMSQAIEKSGRRLRWAMWLGLVALIFLILFGLELEPGTPPRRVMAIAVSVLTSGLVIFAFYAAAKTGEAQFLASLTIELTRDGLIRRRADEPAVSIAYSDISAVVQTSQGLRINSAVGDIWIPAEICCFSDIREQLSQIRPINPDRFSILPWVSPVLLVICWVLLYSSRSREVVVTAACGIVLFQSWETGWLLRRFRKAGASTLVIAFVLTWLLALWLVHQRVFR